MPKNFINKSSKNPDPYDFDYLEASSSNECTGLIPTAPEDWDEMESYNEIFHFLPEAEKQKNTNLN